MAPICIKTPSVIVRGKLGEYGFWGNFSKSKKIKTVNHKERSHISIVLYYCELKVALCKLVPYSQTWAPATFFQVR